MATGGDMQDELDEESDNSEDDPIWKRVMRKCNTKLVEDMEPGVVLDQFYKKSFLQRTTLRDIRELQLTSDKNRKIIAAVINKDVKGNEHFKTCLRKTGQDYIADRLVKMETKLKQEQSDSSEEDELHKRVLGKCYPNLVNKLVPKPLIDTFRKVEFLSGTSLRNIEEIENSSDQNRAIIDAVSTKGSTGYTVFNDCLKNTNQNELVNLLSGKENRLKQSSQESNKHMPTETKTFYSEPDVPKARKQPLRMGESVGNSCERFGTLGAFVDLPNGSIGCITCAHVLRDGNECGLLESNAFHKVYQPAPTFASNSDNQPFGRIETVLKATGGTGVDVCLMSITDRNRYPEIGRFPEVTTGFTLQNEFHFISDEIYTSLPTHFRGKHVYKNGATTGITRGVINDVNVSVGLRERGALVNQIEVGSVNSQSFAEAGDSGALVCVQNNDSADLRALGILTGGHGHSFYVTPICDILAALGLPLKLKSFEKNDEMDLTNNNVCASVPLRKEAFTFNIKKQFIEKINHIGDNIGKLVTKVKNTKAQVNILKSNMNAMHDVFVRDYLPDNHRS